MDLTSSVFGKIKNPFVWITIILVVVIIAAVAIERVVHDRKKNNIIEGQAELIKNYQNAKVTVDTVFDTIYMPGRVTIKPIPIKTPVFIHDTMRLECRRYMYDSLFNEGGLKFRWLAFGNLDYITFGDFTFPKEIITITKQVDTCIMDTNKQPALRWGVYAGAAVNSFNKFPGVEAGAQLVIKDQMTISAGGLLLDGIYANIRFGWLFKK